MELEGKIEQVEGLSNAITSLMNENARLRERVSKKGAGADAQDLQKHLEEREKEIKELTEKLGALEDQLAEVRGRAEEREKELGERNAEIKELKEELKKISDDNGELKVALERIESSKEDIEGVLIHQ